MITPAGDSLLIFNWTFGDPASGNANNTDLYSPSHTFTLPGLYSVMLNATDQYGCSATTMLDIEIKAMPVASFTYATGLCDSTVMFTSTSVDPGSSITTYIWSYGDGAIDTILAPTITATHKYPTAGVYNATLKVINLNGCSGNDVKLIQQNTCIVSAFTNNDTLSCQNNILTFTDHSISSGTISEWQWTWGDGSPPTVYFVFQPKTSHTYTSPGFYNVSLKVTTIVNGVSFADSTFIAIRVFGSPTANFDQVNTCLNDEVNFHNTSNANGAVVLYYNWDFGDPGTVNDTSILRNPGYTYTSAGLFNAQLVVFNELGCSDTVVKSITVNNLPTAAFDYSISCVDHQTFFFDHSDTAQAPIVHWGWRVSSTEQLGWMSGETTSFVFDTLGTYNVMLTVSDSNNCIDTITKQISVNPSPVSAFSINENYGYVQGQIQLLNGTIGASQYYWEFGNGTISGAESPVTTYNEDGNYLITLTSTNNFGCTDTTSILYEFLFKGLWIPNAFTPNGPVEEVRLFKPIGINLASYKAEVFDSFGNLIWSSTLLDQKGSPIEGWDGTLKGNPCQQDVYVWKISAIFRDGSIWRNTDVGNRDYLNNQPYGTVTLIR